MSDDGGVSILGHIAKVIDDKVVGRGDGKPGEQRPRAQIGC